MLVTTLSWEVFAGEQPPRIEAIIRLRTRIAIMRILDFFINTTFPQLSALA
ncbi:unnamed protein product, partial [marine sediment metagenome]